ncbi:MAG: inorganic phosphate transporter [Alphaproteobacteria bacterium]
MEYHILYLTVVIVLVALVFDFTNGFHDAANSIATIVATKVLTPIQAVLWAAAFNVLALFVFDTGVAKTVGSGMIDLAQITLPVVLAGLLGAIIWNLATWWVGMPSSSSHALIGGYAGAAVMHRAWASDFTAGFDVLIASGWSKVLIFILLAPIIGWILALLLTKLVHMLERYGHIGNAKFFGRMQLVSSAFLSLTHGGNDAQKTAGIIAGALAAGSGDAFHIPYWVLVVSYLTIGLGTLAGGWRIVNTMGFKITPLNTQGGFCAESGAALTIMTATLLKLPISTTHATTGAIMGVGFAKGEPVRWAIAKRIVWTWVLTLPGSAALGALAITLLEQFL